MVKIDPKVRSSIFARFRPNFGPVICPKFNDLGLVHIPVWTFYPDIYPLLGARPYDDQLTLLTQVAHLQHISYQSEQYQQPRTVNAKKTLAT